MDSKLLTEDGWKTVARKFNIKDTSLQKQLFLLETFDENEYEDRLKGLASVMHFAEITKNSKEAKASPDVVKYLSSLLSAAQSEQREVTKAKANADKAAANQAKADAQKQREEQDAGEEEEGGGDFAAKLLATFQKLKGSKGLSYEFIICEAKPIGLMVAKKIAAPHKAQLGELTGSKRFYPIGTCHFEDGKFHFVMEKPISGLARRLQESIKEWTGKKFPIVAGAESVGEEDELAQSATASPAQAAVKPNPAMERAPEVWHKTRNAIEKAIAQLKTAVRKDFANDEAALVAEVEESLGELDRILEKLDHRLAESLTAAHAAKDAAAHNTAMGNSRNILKEYLAYVEKEPLLAHIDDNPFGVKTNLKPTLAASLKHLGEIVMHRG